MGNYKIKLNLRQLNSVGLMDIRGRSGIRRCVVIPVEDNGGIYVGEKGIYLGLDMIEKRETGQWGDTHYLRQQVGKEERERLAAEGRRVPIVGSATPAANRWHQEQSGGAPAGEAVSAESADDGDLPF